jgi:hypothetical protein
MTTRWTTYLTRNLDVTATYEATEHVEHGLGCEGDYMSSRHLVYQHTPGTCGHVS